MTLEHVIRRSLLDSFFRKNNTVLISSGEVVLIARRIIAERESLCSLLYIELRCVLTVPGHKNQPLGYLGIGQSFCDQAWNRYLSHRQSHKTC
jgi:hypothetical protein